MASLQFAILWYFCFSVHWVVNGASGDEYYIGTGRYDITGPAVETEMMGYAMPTQINNGIHFRQYSRAFIVADSLKKTRIVFINTDICMGSQIIKIQVLKKLQNLYGKTYSDANVLISGIHTHSGPAGYFQYVLFEVMSLGFVNQTLDAIVDGIVESVKIAHDNMVLGHLFINSGMLLDASINRSPSAYLNNAEEERSLKQKQSMAPGNKSKRRRGFRSHFKRSKNDERKRLESRLKDREGRVALQPISSNVSCADASTFTPLSFHTLKTDVPPDWVVFESEDTIRFCLMKSTPPTVTRSVSVNADFTWYIHAHGRVVPRDNEIIKRLPEKVASVSVLRDILSVVKAARKCPGNPEERFVQVIEKRGGSVVGVDGKVSAIIDNQEDIVSGGITYSKTVRHTDCEVFCSPDTANLRRCPCCKKYRSQLHVMYSRQSKASDRVSHNSHTNYRFLSSAEKDERLHNLQRAKVAQNKCNKRLSEKLNELIDNEGVRLTEQDTSDVTSIFNSVTDDVIKNFKDGSIQQIFWEQQKNYSLLSNKKSMKWHPLVIRFALSLKYASSSAYRMARNSGLIALPSERTLRDYTHWITVKDGIQAEMVQQMKKCLEFEGMQTFEKQFSLSMDEIKIRSGLVFKKDTGELTGFCNLGQVNHDLEKLSDYLSDTTPANEVPTLSDQMLVFMVRPIFKPSFSFPVAMYPSTNLTGERLYPIVFEVIEALELHSIPVVSLTSDGNSPNRRLYRLCQLNTEKPTYKTKNPFADRDIFFMCDAPHLIKTARNCLANSHAHSKTRNLQRNGQEISWKHVEQLYLTETEKIGGVRLCPKLTRNHIWLNPYSRMKVYLATQVMSETVASALQLLDEEKTRETRLFIRMMDRFFDALNVKNPLEGKHKRKDSRAPYYSTKDERFKWLKETFLNYLDNWEREAMSDKKFRAKENRRKCISRETLEGLKITVKSFLELGPMLLQKPGAKYLLSEVFSQDPLERYFSKQRHRGGSNDNPTVEEFRTNTATLVQQQSIHKDLKTMNVEAGCNQVDVSAVCQPLRKRRRVSTT